MKRRPHILPIIIISQFACTSLWFAGNAIVDELAIKTGLGAEIVGHVLSSVNFGFIIGTLVFALLMIADRYSPSRVFMVCALLASVCNLLLLANNVTTSLLVVGRFGTGFFLAGIYPVGMKIAADYYKSGLGKALGFLVGALVFGTAFPYLMGGTTWGNDYTLIIKATSGLALFGGLLLWILVPNGPFRKPATQLQLKAGPALFKIVGFRKAALGYFGHMWELYAFWAFTPLAVQTFNILNEASLSVPLWTGITIALGGLSCVLGGLLSERLGSYKVATSALLVSGLFCLLSPLLFQLPPYVFLVGWCLWGMAVTADSPQFSNLVASAVPPELKGTGLTLVNCIGFAISIVSIQLVSFSAEKINPSCIFLILTLGPALGVANLLKKNN
ncbi:MFS transporter [Kriegella aquimaris]|uniref:Predicted arabinose efflux permease, MFS family n=1 Tax=Kriegella aquimaris TaxID=192904 RepID=A0A1G9NPV4_9FLAO|nr:MFS transporter [Kriegella aquimaris]SDL88616.1 Predicted arabinose efflux permease, MFS family [Kriegella aquimaris]